MREPMRPTWAVGSVTGDAPPVSSTARQRRVSSIVREPMRPTWAACYVIAGDLRVSSVAREPMRPT